MSSGTALSITRLVSYQKAVQEPSRLWLPGVEKLTPLGLELCIETAHFIIPPAPQLLFPPVARPHRADPSAAPPAPHLFSVKE